MTATAAAPSSPPPRYTRRAIIVALFVAVTGPFIGALMLLAFVLGRIVVGLHYEDGVMPRFADLGQVLIVVSLFAYLLAGFSAVVAGALLGWRTYTHGTFGYRYAMAVAVAATVFGTATLDLILGRSDQSLVGMTIFFTPFSLVAAVAGRCLMANIGILPTTAPTSLAQH